MKFISIFKVLLLAIVLIATGCSKSKAPNDTIVDQPADDGTDDGSGDGSDDGSDGGTNDGSDDIVITSASVSGRVMAENGLAEVLVTLAGLETVSDSDGYFVFEDVNVPADSRFVIKFVKQGFADTVRSVTVTSSDTYSVYATMARFSYSSDPQDPTVASSHTDIAGRVTLDLPANAIIDPYGGDVNINFVPGDPSDPGESATYPGDYQAFSGTQDDIVDLESVTFVDVTIFDSSGDEVTNLDQHATVTLKLPDIYQTGGERAGEYVAGDTIAWWSLDEDTAIWVREDADLTTPLVIDGALLIEMDGMLYAQAQISHLSSWNVDAPISEHSCLGVTVVENGEHVQGMSVTASGVSYSGQSLVATTDENGVAYVNIKRSTTSSTEIVTISAGFGTSQFYYTVTNAEEGEVDTSNIYSPEQQGSWFNGDPGDCIMLENSIEIATDGNVTGTVITENGDVPIEGARVYSSLGQSVITNADGEFSLPVPLNTNIEISVRGADSQTVQANESIPDIVLELIVANTAPYVKELYVDHASLAYENSEVVELFVDAIDIDGDALTYSWTTSIGSLSTTTGTSLEWTAPGAGAGTATVQVTISDGDKTSVESILLPYGATGSDTGGGTNILKAYIVDGSRPTVPVSSVYVILHTEDGIGVESYLVTGADGIADFGDVGRALVTVTVAYEYESITESETYSSKFTSKQITTYKDIVPAEFTWYASAGADTICSTITNITVEITGAPEQYDYIFLPGYSNMSNGITSASFDICDEDLNEDGSLDLHALAFQYEENDNGILIEYGTLSIADVLITNTYTIDLNKQPGELEWSSNKLISQFNLVDDYVYSYIDFPNTTEGSLLWASDLTSDSSKSIHASFGDWEDEGSTLLQAGVRSIDIPATIGFTFPDIEITELAYNEDSSTVTWETSGDVEASDMYFLLSKYTSDTNYEVTPILGTTDYLYWSLMSSADTNTHTLPELPEVISDWLTEDYDNENLQLNINYIAQDEDFSEFISAIMQGDDPDAFGWMTAVRQLTISNQEVDSVSTIKEGKVAKDKPQTFRPSLPLSERPGIRELIRH